MAGAEKGPGRGRPGWCEGCGNRWRRRRTRGVDAFGPGAHGDAVLIRARAKVSRGWRRVALATLVVPHPSGLAVGPKTTPKHQPPLALCLSFSPLLPPLSLSLFLSVLQSLLLTLFSPLLCISLSPSLALPPSLYYTGLAIYTCRTNRPVDDAHVYACEVRFSRYFGLPSGILSLDARLSIRK